jgi:hypothetical protein
MQNQAAGVSKYILRAAFLRRNYPVQVQRVPVLRYKRTETDLSPAELPQGRIESLQY